MTEAKRDGKIEVSASDWFVAIDARRVDAAADETFGHWLAADSEREAELARCEAALALTKQLGDTAKIASAFNEAQRLAAGEISPVRRGWLRHPALPWSVAAASLVVAATAWLEQGRPPRSAPPPVTAAASTGTPTDSAGPSIDVASAESAVALPGPIIVDARSVAVLPFAEVSLEPGEDDGGALAASLYDEVVRALSAVPGVYVVDRGTVAPYAGSGMDAGQIAAQLGVRGIVEARVSMVEGRVQVTLQLTDAARAAPPTRDAFDRPFGELSAMRAEIVSNIALALAASPEPPAYVPSLPD